MLCLGAGIGVSALGLSLTAQTADSPVDRARPVFASLSGVNQVPSSVAGHLGLRVQRVMQHAKALSSSLVPLFGLLNLKVYTCIVQGVST